MDLQTKNTLDAVQEHFEDIQKQLSECFTLGYASRTYIHSVATNLALAGDSFIQNSSSGSFLYTGKRIASLADINMKLRQIAAACIDDNHDIAKHLRDDILATLRGRPKLTQMEAA